MSEANRLVTKVSNGDEKPKNYNKKIIKSLEDLKDRIKNMDGWDEEKKKKFIDYFSKYPQGSLDHVWRNLHQFAIFSTRPTKSTVIEEIMPVVEEEIVVEKKPEKKNNARPSLQDILRELEND